MELSLFTRGYVDGRRKVFVEDGAGNKQPATLSGFGSCGAALWALFVTEEGQEDTARIDDLEWRA